MNRKKYRKWLLLIFGVYIVAFLYYLSHLPLTMPVDAGVTAERKVMPLGLSLIHIWKPIRESWIYPFSLRFRE